MEVITIESQAYSDLIRKIEELKNQLVNKTHDHIDKVIDNSEFIRLMNVSKRTAQAWRDEGIITFSQIGSKIYYKQSDIQQMIERYRKPAFKRIK